MKFYIDGNEIKTINNGAVIEGSVNSISRRAFFSYAYNPEDSNFEVYRACVDSNVIIKNDDNKGIFVGTVAKISYETNKKIINIEAKDLFSLLSDTKVKGRFRGLLSSIIAQAAGKFNIISAIQTMVSKEINILSFGTLSIYDVIHMACSKVFGDEFRLYLDGEGKIKILIPLISSSVGDFVIGQNILSSSFVAKGDFNLSAIKAIGNDNVVSGSIIRVLEPESGIFGYFIVQKDVHTYGVNHTMELELKEKRFIL